jgi:membrane dipeptidase
MSDDHVAAARRIHADLPVVDGHNDLPWEIRTRARGSLDEADPAAHLEGFHTDFPRLLAGGVGVQFWSVYVPTWSTQPRRDTHRQIDLVEEMSRRVPDLTTLARDSRHADQIRAAGRIAGFMGAEGGHSIEGSLDALSGLRERGVRYMTLTHADTHDWADSATDEARHGGLTAFGEAVVREMNRLGMMVDISHVSADTMRHAIRVSRAPVIASHSSAYALAPHPRNVPDDVLRMVGDTGGVVMVAFVPAFVVASTALLALDMFEEARQLRAQFAPDDEEGFRAARRAQVQDLEIERGGVPDVADHVEYVAEVAGIDHVGLGSDFDGVDLVPEGLDDASCYPAITAELLRRGWREPEVRKVLGTNALRVLRVAEQIAGG